MTVTASLIGIGFTVVALLVLVRALQLKDMVRLVKRGLLAILAFVVLGSVAQMFLPGVLTAGVLTAGFLACARSSLLLGVAIVVIALALMLIASRRQSGSSGHNRH